MHANLHLSQMKITPFHLFTTGHFYNGLLTACEKMDIRSVHAESRIKVACL
jgi:hypothetical protein